MNVLAATESDSTLRIRRPLGSNARRMGAGSRLLAAILFSAACAVALPSCGTDDKSTGTDAAGAGAEVSSEALKTQTGTAGEVAARDAASDLNDIGRRIRAAVAAGEMTPEQGRARYQAARERLEGEATRTEQDEDSARLSEFRRGVVERVMAVPPEEWSGRLKEAIAHAGWDLDEFAEGIRLRQQMGRSERDDGVDWAAVRSTPPEEWSEELKAQIVAAGHDVEAMAERVRQGQAAATPDAATPGLDDLGRRIRAAVAAGEMTPEQGRARYQAARESLADEGGGDGIDRLREFRRAVAERAMGMPPEEWSDGLKAAIVRAGWDLDEFTEGIRRRQAAANESRD